MENSKFEKKCVEIHFHTTNREQRTFIKEAATNGWLSDLDQNVLNGNYGQVDANKHEYETIREARSNAYTFAEKKLLSYLAYKDPKHTIECAVAKLIGCSKYDIIVYIGSLEPCTILGKSGYRFEAGYARGATIKGEMMILDTQAKILFDCENDMDACDSMDDWLENNPMPEITDLNSFEQAMAKSVWAFESGIACAHFDNCLENEVTGYKWAIEQAIINRNEDKTMLQAGLEWVENRLQTI